ncbi:MAG TPA: Hpt domain-containing protein, partial [Gammaproteobacteria bacterium]
MKNRTMRPGFGTTRVRAMADHHEELAAALAALPAEIRTMLAEDLPVDRQRCEEAFAAQRWGQLREQVHRIKGSAQFCHLDALHDVCRRIEDKAGAGCAPEGADMETFTAEVGR